MVARARRYTARCSTSRSKSSPTVRRADAGPASHVSACRATREIAARDERPRSPVRRTRRHAASEAPADLRPDQLLCSGCACPVEEPDLISSHLGLNAVEVIGVASRATSWFRRRHRLSLTSASNCPTRTWMSAASRSRWSPTRLSRLDPGRPFSLGSGPDDTVFAVTLPTAACSSATASAACVRSPGPHPRSPLPPRRRQRRKPSIRQHPGTHGASESAVRHEWPDPVAASSTPSRWTKPSAASRPFLSHCDRAQSRRGLQLCSRATTRSTRSRSAEAVAGFFPRRKASPRRGATSPASSAFADAAGTVQAMAAAPRPERRAARGRTRTFGALHARHRALRAASPRFVPIALALARGGRSDERAAGPCGGSSAPCCATRGPCRRVAARRIGHAARPSRSTSCAPRPGASRAWRRSMRCASSTGRRSRTGRAGASLTGAGTYAARLRTSLSWMAVPSAPGEDRPARRAVSGPEAAAADGLRPRRYR